MEEVRVNGEQVAVLPSRLPPEEPEEGETEEGEEPQEESDPSAHKVLRSIYLSSYLNPSIRAFHLRVPKCSSNL